MVNDRGRPYPQYPLDGRGSSVFKAYVEAVRDQKYSVQIRNRSNQRIGVVIAVDGRNIISGDRSNLRPDERMYVLGPYQQETYEGWRTGEPGQPLYFTDAGDSYPGPGAIIPAMGVIAVAAFRSARLSRGRGPRMVRVTASSAGCERSPRPRRRARSGDRAPVTARANGRRRGGWSSSRCRDRSPSIS